MKERGNRILRWPVNALEAHTKGTHEERISTKIYTLVYTLVVCNPYRYKVCMNERKTDKGEVGGSSPPRPTNL